ncbi:MAG: penicillin-binding protein 2 [Clostridia bacterium]|nr:penicillin-binding protein 2 [Clostridia bacterium]
MDKKPRLTVYIVFVVIVCAIFVVRLFNMQIINGDEFLKISQQKQMRRMNIAAPRGEIYDRYGVPLITNEVGYCVQIQRIGLEAEELNDILLKLYDMIESDGAEVSDSLPISEEPFSFNFSESYSDIEEIKKAEARFKKSMEYDADITAPQVIEALKERYDVAPSYTPQEARKIVGVRYEMEKRGFSVSEPFVMASDISMELVTKIRESQAEYKCVNIASEYVRSYSRGTMAAHILGRIGRISDTEYEELKGDGYRMSDMIGKQGIEKVCESYLKGEDGSASLVQTQNGFEVQSDLTVEPVQGNYVTLTLDAGLQETLETALAETIEQIRARGGDPKYKSGGDAYCGAGVVMDVNTGEVLAIASHPTYDISNFSKVYNQLLKDENMPLWNRALSAAYPPGSTFKMLTSIAALESGTVTPNTVIEDEGVYKYYPDYQPRCWIWKSRWGQTHGPQTVTDAIKNSCNYYYYESGRLMGIETLNKYGKMFGFGQRTGFELASEEAAGRLAGPEDREKNGGGRWQPGDTLQAAIGQSDNLMTPLQLANYICTLVNGGSRYEPHIIKSVRSPVDGSIVYATEPKMVEQINMKDVNINAVLNGMLAVTEDGTASSVFEEYPIRVGGKTGSAQVARGSDNGVFVGFAPFDRPEIAIAIVVEHGNSGSDVAPIAKAVMDKYFAVETDMRYTPPAQTLLR